MIEITVFTQEDSDYMNKLGYEKFCNKRTDINGKCVWIYRLRDISYFEANRLPQSAIVTDRVCMNF